MNSKEFNRNISDVPQYAAIFEVIKVPDWLDNGRVRKGMKLIMVNHRHGQLENYGNVSIGPSYLKFLGYAQIEEELDGRLKIVGEIKK